MAARIRVIAWGHVDSALERSGQTQQTLFEEPKPQWVEVNALLPHKGELEIFLKEKLGELFELEYDLLLYDVTSTSLEGEANANPLAQRGYSRDKRGDCKQVCIGLVVSRCGMPLGYEVFAGNTADVTTVEHIVTTMESRYGQSNRIWAMDRGMISEENIEFFREGGRRDIVGTPEGRGCSRSTSSNAPMAGRKWPGRRSTPGATGHNSAKAATCCAAT